MKKKILIFDFDGTLTPYPSTKYEILAKAGYTKESGNKEYQEVLDEGYGYLDGYYEFFLRALKKGGVPLTDESVIYGADKVKYNEGVETFLSKLGEVSSEELNCYILSSGFRAYLQNIIIRKYFKDVFGTTMKYNDGVIEGIDLLLDEMMKVDVIKNILALEGKTENDCSEVYYIGDGLTDVHAMRYVKSNGGTSIFIVHKNDMSVYDKLKKDNVVDIAFSTDFSKGKGIYDYFIKE